MTERSEISRAIAESNFYSRGNGIMPNGPGVWILAILLFVFWAAIK